MRLQLLCSSLQSLRSLPLSCGGDSLLPKLKNCTSLHPLRTEFGMSRVYCSLIVGIWEVISEVCPPTDRQSFAENPECLSILNRTLYRRSCAVGALFFKHGT